MELCVYRNVDTGTISILEATLDGVACGPHFPDKGLEIEVWDVLLFHLFDVLMSPPIRCIRLLLMPCGLCPPVPPINVGRPRVSPRATFPCEGRVAASGPLT